MADDADNAPGSAAARADPAGTPSQDLTAAPPVRSSARKRKVGHNSYAALNENDDDVQVTRRWSVLQNGDDEGDDEVEITKVVSKRKSKRQVARNYSERALMAYDTAELSKELKTGTKKTQMRDAGGSGTMSKHELKKLKREEKMAKKEKEKNDKEKEKNDSGENAREKRLRRQRLQPPKCYNEIKERAMTQRMFVVDRRRSGNEECPEEEVDLVGTTGNIYTVTINELPRCTCPFSKSREQCKHIVYVLIRVLHAPEHLEYQLAFLKPELREIFAKAPPIPSADANAAESDGKRKAIEDDCPICCMEFEPEKEKIVYCKAACGNNIHQSCLDRWAASKGGGAVTCPFCREPWQNDDYDIRKIAESGTVNADGYVNVAGQLGITGERDYSTYHDFWVRQRARDGLIDGRWRDHHRF